MSEFLFWCSSSTCREPFSRVLVSVDLCVYRRLNTCLQIPLNIRTIYIIGKPINRYLTMKYLLYFKCLCPHRIMKSWRIFYPCYTTPSLHMCRKLLTNGNLSPSASYKFYRRATSPVCSVTQKQYRGEYNAMTSENVYTNPRQAWQKQTYRYQIYLLF